MTPRVCAQLLRIRTRVFPAQASQRCMAVQVSFRVLEVLPISYTMDSIRFPLSLTPETQTSDTATVPATSAPGLRSPVWHISTA